MIKNVDNTSIESVCRRKERVQKGEDSLKMREVRLTDSATESDASGCHLISTVLFFFFR